VAVQRTLARQHAGPDRRPPAPVAAPQVRASAPAATTAQLLQRKLGSQGAAAFVTAHVGGREKDDEQKVKARETAGAPRASSLSISSPTDPAEREAVAVASSVVRLPAPPSAPTRPPAPGPGPRLVRRAEIAASHMPPRTDKPPTVEPKVAGDIQSNLSGGAPLPGPVRAFMEPRFKADFGAVRVHTDEKAAALSQQVNARAFTVGQHVFFGKGAYQPDTTEGQELIAHELTHTIQQGAAVQRSEAPAVTQQSPPQVQRWGLSDALDYIADKANIIPGFRMLTVILGLNPINMSPVARSGANVLRALIEFMPGGGLITQALESSGAFDKAGAWIEQQVKTLGMAGATIKRALTTFLDSLGWSDILSPGDVWERAKKIFTDPIDRLKDFAVNAVSAIVQLIKDAILMPLAKLAESTRGWDLLIAVLGKNPITGAPVPRTAETLIPGFLKLIGQEEVWENMKKSNAIPRVWAWFQGALKTVMGFVSQIPTLFVNALKSLELSDIILPIKAFGKVAAVFGNFILDFITWAGQALWTLLELIFEVVSPKALAYIKKTGSALKSILKNPLPFVGNLVKAAKLGFQNFADHFGAHLKAGLIDWLTGSLPGVYIPKAFELGEIVKFVFSVLGLSWANIRQKLVKVVGEPAVKAMETGFDIVVTLVTQGPAAAWEKIKESLSNLKDMVIGGITDFVIETVVTKAIPKLIAMFIPGAGFISAIVSIYDTIMVFVNKIAKIIEVVTAFLDSIVAIASGAITAAATKVENILAGLLSLAINFFAGFIGLGKVADKIMGVLNKVRGVIDKGIDALINWIVTMAKKLFAKVFSKDPKDERTPQQKQADLDKGLADAEAVAAKPDVTEAQIRQALPAIKAKYKMTALELVVDSKDDEKEGIHFHGEVNPPGDTKKSFIKSSEDGVITEISISRPSFSKKTKDAVNPDELDLVAEGLDRCHVVSSNDMSSHYESTLKGKKWSQAIKLLEDTNTTTVEKPQKDKQILAAARALHKTFFNDVENLFLGDASENRSLGERLDPRHPKMKDKANSINAKIKAHVRKMANKYALSKDFKPTL